MQGIADAGEIVVRIDVLALYAALTAVAAVHPTCKGEVWLEPTREMRPWVYNWWHASAIDEEGMEVQCAELAAKGFGGFHVIHIYGVDSLRIPRARAQTYREAMKRVSGCDLLCFGKGWSR
jgi:hypothetical protein